MPGAGLSNEVQIMPTAVESPSRIEWLTREQAAAYIGVKPNTLAVWSLTGRYNLRFTKLGRFVRYRKSDLDEFIERRSGTASAEIAAASA
jgi:excisionase family DNA binding protein